MRSWSPNLSSVAVHNVSEVDPKNYEVAEQSVFQLQTSRFPTWKSQNPNPMCKVLVKMKPKNSILENLIVFWFHFRYYIKT